VRVVEHLHWGRGAAILGAFVALLTASAVPAPARAATTDLGTVGFGAMVVDDANQHVFVSEPKANAVAEFDFAGKLIATVADVYGAWGMTLSGDDLYVAESTTGDIVRIDLTASPLAPETVATGLNDPIWLVMTGGNLWAAEESEGKVVSVDPWSGTTSPLAGSFYGPDLAVSPGDPDALFVAEDGLSPGAIYRLDVSTSPATEIAENTTTDQSNIEDLAVSPDGTRVIPASGAPYLFEELSASTLQADGVRYPGAPYPSAVAVSSSGLVATGLEGGYSSPDIAIYALGKPAATWTATTNNCDGTANVLPHGLALSADGSKLFAVTGDESGDDLSLSVFIVGSSVAPPSCGHPPGGPGPVGSNPGGGSPTGTQPGGGSQPGPGPSSPQTPIPPNHQITPRKSRGHHPDVYVELSAVRESFSSGGYRYFFSARNMRCINGATDVAFTVGGSRHVAPCRRGLMLISKRLTPHRMYNVKVQALRMHRHRAVKKGPAHSWRVYMPGNEVNWS
jgi:sugar lactone lactonase YvrE